MVRGNVKIAGLAFAVKVYIFVLLMLLVPQFHLYPGDQSLDLEHIKWEYRLSDDTIFCIFQDSMGFLWFGTNNGLKKYDGYDFKTYWHLLENPGSLSDNSVRTIIEDRSGALWIGTLGGGLNKFHPKTETFTHYIKDSRDSNSLSNNFVVSLLEDREGIIWIGTYDGLDRFDTRTGIFTHYRQVPGNSRSLSDNRILSIIEDRSGFLWIGTEKGGLNRFLPTTGEFTHYTANPADPHSLSNNHVTTILEDPEGILWIGTNGGGLNKFSPKTGSFTRFMTDAGDAKSLSNNEIRIIYPDKTGELWIGTSGGLNRFHREKEEFTRYQADPAIPHSLSVNTIRSIYEDRSGVLWIGTEFGGLNKISKEKKRINHYCHVPNDPTSLSNNIVVTIYEDRADVLWIGTFGGLNKWDRRNKTFFHYRHNPRDSTSLSDDLVWCIYEDRSGSFWVGTMTGLNQFERKNEKFTRFHSDPKNPNSLSDNKIISIIEDFRGFLWFGTFDGLNRLDREKWTFKCYRNEPGNPNSLSHNTILSLLEDRYGMLWVGTLVGLNSFNQETGTFTRYLANPEDADSLSSDKINCIYEDHSGILWFGTHSGLNRYDRKTGTFIHYTKEDGLPSDLMMGILEDDRGNLWLSTDYGLSKFDPKTRKFNNYDSSDGLMGNRFIYAHYKSKSGEMFFGGIKGFNSFFPDHIIDNPYPPDVVITDVKILNKKVVGLTALDQNISKANEVKLSYKNTMLSFDYVGLHYAAPESNRYAYKMEGLEKDWNYAGRRRYAVYPQLAPGHYIFRVKASNNDNVWNETGASIKIYIPPPFWQQLWFRVLLGVMIILILIGGYTYRTERLRKKLTEQERVQEMLKQSRDEMRKSRDIAEIRSAENEKLIAAISSIFITVDANGKISQWNHSAEKFFKIHKTRAKEQLFTQILKGYISDSKLAEITEKGQNQEKIAHNIEIQVNFKKKNKTKLLLATINPITDKNGKEFGFLLLAEDITHKKKEQIQMLVSQKLEALGQMAAGIAHEIRSPLQYIGDNVRFLLETFGTLMESCVEIKDSIKNAAKSGKNVDVDKLNQYLRQKDFDFFIEEIPSALDHIINGVSRVSHIVKSMTEFSHIGREVYEKADLNEMLKATLVVAQNRIKKVADLQVAYAPGLPPIYCSMGELNQVLLNLLINAADAITETGKHGLIKVSTKQAGGELIVEISDNGIGIPDEIKDKIFTPFFTTKEVGQGTGQGLPFSYSIVVERHKGKLYFESKVNEGTTFFIHLPVTENPEESQ